MTARPAWIGWFAADGILGLWNLNSGPLQSCAACIISGFFAPEPPQSRNRRMTPSIQRHGMFFATCSLVPSESRPSRFTP